jgi:hypothetical protein
VYGALVVLGVVAGLLVGVQECSLRYTLGG